MTSEEVKQLIEADPDLSPAEKQKILKNLLTVRLANNRRVDVTLSTTGEQSVRRFPFNAKDALTLLSRAGGETGKTGKTGKTGTTGKAKTPAPAPRKSRLRSRWLSRAGETSCLRTSDPARIFEIQKRALRATLEGPVSVFWEEAQE